MKTVPEGLIPETFDADPGAGREEECLAAYWACRNALLEEYGKEHFFDLDSVIPEEARRKLDFLMDRYVEEAKKSGRSAA